MEQSNECILSIYLITPLFCKKKKNINLYVFIEYTIKLSIWIILVDYYELNF